MADQYCVVGEDVSRSPSPAMMNAAFRSSEIDARYTAVSVLEAGFPREFRRLMSSRFKGMNVTMPFKTAVIPLLAGLDPVATRIQSVNTVKGDEDGRYLGYSTDPDGILKPLQAIPATLDVRNAMLIGAGGAARAFCEAMNRMGCVDVAVAVRNVERAREFVRGMEGAFPRMNLTLASMENLRHLNHDLVFNASPMGAGGEPLPAEMRRVLPGSKIVFDAVYRPRETELLAEAKRNGSKVVYGEEMLLYQGMAAFKAWTGREAPEKLMREALSGSLEGERKQGKGGGAKR
ncbi:MAG TPA: shikimate dehydrogenase [Nitrososphaerales archaeon]|nr:shikimate dehydrogenase [Nitrososphaerales archaeon]